MSVKIVLDPKYNHLRGVVESIAANGVGPDARLIYRARNSVYTINAGAMTLNVKDFRTPGFPNSYVYRRLRPSKARRSFVNAQRLLRMGFGTPAPVAYIEVSHAGRLTRSYYISEQVQASDFRLWIERGPAFTPVLQQLAAYMHRLHRAGVYHKDFSPGNVMYTLGPGGRASFYLIDLNRMRFGVHSHTTLMRNFSAIYIESRDETARLARMYAAVTGDDEARTVALALRYYDRRAQHKNRMHKLKKIFKRR